MPGKWTIAWLRSIHDDVAESTAAYRLYLDASPEPAGDRIRRALLESAFLGARRQLDTDNKTISLLRLLQRLPRAKTDLAYLFDTGRPILEYVDRAIAHRDKRGGGPPPLAELEALLNLLGGMVNHYNARLGAGLEDLPPLVDDGGRESSARE